jgi:hypothetical protein
MLIKVLLGMNKNNRGVGDVIEVSDTRASGMIIAVGEIVELVAEGGLLVAVVRVVVGF